MELVSEKELEEYFNRVWVNNKSHFKDLSWIFNSFLFFSASSGVTSPNSSFVFRSCSWYFISAFISSMFIASSYQSLSSYIHLRFVQFLGSLLISLLLHQYFLEFFCPHSLSFFHVAAFHYFSVPETLHCLHFVSLLLLRGPTWCLRVDRTS